MSRRLGASAEIARRSNESCAEVMKPQAIHKDPCRQWILLAGDGFGQFEPSAAFGKGLPLLACEDFQELFWDFFALVDWIASFENARVLLHRAVFENDGVRRRAGRLQNPFVNLRGELAQFHASRLVEIPFQVHNRPGRHRGR